MTQPTTPSSRLKQRTLALVRSMPRDRSLTQLAEACGLPLAWLSAFTRGEIDQPSIDRVECLYEHLTGKPVGLDVD